MSPICILRSIWWSLKTGERVSGHAFVEVQDGQPKCVQILRCCACSKVSVAWQPCPRCSSSATAPREGMMSDKYRQELKALLRRQHEALKRAASK